MGRKGARKHLWVETINHYQESLFKSQSMVKLHKRFNPLIPLKKSSCFKYAQIESNLWSYSCWPLSTLESKDKKIEGEFISSDDVLPEVFSHFLESFLIDWETHNKMPSYTFAIVYAKYKETWYFKHSASPKQYIEILHLSERLSIDLWLRASAVVYYYFRMF